MFYGYSVDNILPWYQDISLFINFMKSFKSERGYMWQIQQI